MGVVYSTLGLFAVRAPDDFLDANGEVAQKYRYASPPQCNGANATPVLRWQNASTKAKYFAVHFYDETVDWTHWLVYDIKGQAPNGSFAGGSNGITISNSWKKKEYGGPCPPSGAHTYRFALYALENKLENAGTTIDSTLNALKTQNCGVTYSTSYRATKTTATEV